MKWRIVLALVVLVASALASITLDASKVQTYQEGGVTLESNNSAALVGYQVDYLAQQLELVYATGVIQNGELQLSSTSKRLKVTISLQDGTWATSRGAEGALSGAQLTAVKNLLKNQRNTMETQAINLGWLQGTQVPW